VTDSTPSIVAGTITVTGTDVNDAAQTEAFDLSTALSFTGAKVFKTVTRIASAGVTVLGGAGDETIIAGVGSVVSYIYCSTTEPINSQARVITSGSSTTVTTVGSASAFGGMAVGDDLGVNVAGTVQRRTVTAIGSSHSLTIDSAANWQNGTDGYAFEWRHVTCGYSDTSGWKAVNALRNPNVYLQLGSGDGTALTATGGLDVSVECRYGGDATLPSQVLYLNMTSVLRPTNSQVVPLRESCSSARVGFKWGTVDTAGTDSVSAYLFGSNITGGVQ
jgi:hypothetical protein